MIIGWDGRGVLFELEGAEWLFPVATWRPAMSATEHWRDPYWGAVKTYRVSTYVYHNLVCPECEFPFVHVSAEGGSVRSAVCTRCRGQEAYELTPLDREVLTRWKGRLEARRGYRLRPHRDPYHQALDRARVRFTHGEL